MKKLNISERRSGKVIVVDLEGNIRLGDGSMEFRRLISQLAQNGEKKILLNLARVTYIDSSGLGEIVAGFTSLRKVDGRMKLLHLTQRVNELMMITKLLTVFETFDDETEAVGSFEKDSENIAPEQSSVVTGKLNPAIVNL
ncbi:MAG TPA: STAS domain-containing protein [Pyrinomonadaceae bacterium]|jgi:anti-sigma B factor antagonist